ncbi:MAG: hypothetical protein Q8P02_01995 [Candidatus Micrarchaeota archaeon]|nr:hypothetical protein [Candidatus Micrarchaeota archaeon]
MKKRWWFWFLVWTVPFAVLTAFFTPLLFLGLLGFFALYAFLAWEKTGFTKKFKVYKQQIKDPTPLAELSLVGVLVLLFLLAAVGAPETALLVLVALVPLLAGMAFPEASG